MGKRQACEKAEKLGGRKAKNPKTKISEDIDLKNRKN